MSKVALHFYAGQPFSKQLYMCSDACFDSTFVCKGFNFFYLSVAVISPGPLFPTTTSASSKGWDRENNPQSVPSFEEIQRMEEEKEKHARVMWNVHLFFYRAAVKRQQNNIFSYKFTVVYCE